MTIDDLTLPGFDQSPVEQFHLHDLDAEILPEPERPVVLEDDGYDRTDEQ